MHNNPNFHPEDDEFEIPDGWFSTIKVL